MMNKKAFAPIILWLWAIAACSSGSHNDSESRDMVSRPSAAHPQESSAAAPAADSEAGNKMEEASASPPNTFIGNDQVTPQLIRTVDYRFQVDDVDKSAAQVETATRNQQGYVSSSNFNTSSGVKQYNMELRVPNQHLDKLLTDIDKEAVFVNYKNISTSDVTEEYTDIQTRLKTKREVMERYKEVLRKRAQKVEDILDAEEKIRLLQEEIEAKDGRLRYLQNQVQYSTVRLEFYQQSTIQSEPNVVSRSFFSDLGEAFMGGWHSILALVVWLIAMWPTWLILIGVYFIARRLYFRWKR